MASPGRKIASDLAKTRQSFIAAVLTLQLVAIVGVCWALFLFIGWSVSSFCQDVVGVTGEGLIRRLETSVQAAGVVLLGALTLGVGVMTRMHDSNVARIGRELEEQVKNRLREALASRHALIFGLAKLADYRDTDTGSHLERICEYSGMLARSLRSRWPEIDEAWIERLKLASSLHDIGKVGIADAILLKPGRFNAEERREMEKHTIIGADTLIAIRARMGHDPLIDMGIQIALQHHERFDGSGYPLGLRGEEISQAARIVALADFYDALTSRRVYKDPVSHDETTQLIRQERGRQFDPEVADAFFEVAEEFNAVRQRMQSTTTEMATLQERVHRAAA